MINKLKSKASTAIKLSIGWRTKRKILVFESDDWGSVRMPSNEVYDSLSKKGIKLDSEGAYLFNRFDNLANEDDLTALYEVLTSVKDINGNPAVFTAVSVVANPDFDAIRQSNFSQYIYEPFTTTLEKQQGHNRTFTLWQEGITNKIFVPQSHSREHLNTLLWLENLQKGDRETRTAFDYGIWGFDRGANQPSYQEAFSLRTINDVTHQSLIIKEGLELFKSLFGYKSELFVPPNGLLHPTLEHTCHNFGIKYLYGSFINPIPLGGFRKSSRLRFLGKANQYNQKYILRNCLFEPNGLGYDWLSIALKDIETAFKYNKPAILGPHRKNFIGSLNEDNRTNSLKTLKSLLHEVVKRWPDVEFMDSSQLGNLMDRKV